LIALKPNTYTGLAQALAERFGE
ncbi:MAG: hypothetical protein RLZZ345_698, partial [Actinomycetota bacterium]